MRLRKIIPNVMAGIFLLEFISCQSGEEPFEENTNLSTRSIVSNVRITPIEKDSAMTRFAKILSKATYETKEVREFLKEEASKQFDGLNDILYSEVKNRVIGETTFQEILSSYSSIEEILTIEKSVPLLNIYIPEIKGMGISLDSMDCEDAEIPTALYQPNGMELFLNGNLEITIPKGELPNFHSFVVNENERVDVKQDEKGGYAGYNLNCTIPTSALTRAALVSNYKVGDKAIQAFGYFRDIQLKARFHNPKMDCDCRVEARI